MRTGNALAGVFFIWMAFFFPIHSVVELAKQNMLDRLPINLYIFVFVPFAVFIALGIISFAFGWEKKETKPLDFF